MSQFLASGGQSIGASASASVLPMNIQDWLPLGFTSLIFTLYYTELKWYVIVEYNCWIIFEYIEYIEWI